MQSLRDGNSVAPASPRLLPPPAYLGTSSLMTPINQAPIIPPILPVLLPSIFHPPTHPALARSDNQSPAPSFVLIFPQRPDVPRMPPHILQTPLLTLTNMSASVAFSLYSTIRIAPTASSCYRPTRMAPRNTLIFISGVPYDLTPCQT